jgi:hypothetical protein
MALIEWLKWLLNPKSIRNGFILNRHIQFYVVQKDNYHYYKNLDPLNYHQGDNYNLIFVIFFFIEYS